MPSGASAELEIPSVAAVSVAYEDSEDDTGSAHSAVAVAAAGACDIDGDSAAGTQTCILLSPSVVCAPEASQRVHAL